MSHLFRLLLVVHLVAPQKRNNVSARESCQLHEQACAGEASA